METIIMPNNLSKLDVKLPKKSSFKANSCPREINGKEKSSSFLDDRIN